MTIEEVDADVTAQGDCVVDDGYRYDNFANE